MRPQDFNSSDAKRDAIRDLASSNEVFTNAASVIAGFSFTALSIEHSTAFEYQAAENYLSVNVSIAYTALSLGTSLLVAVSECW